MLMLEFDRDALRASAALATPGPWAAADLYGSRTRDVVTGWSDENGRYLMVAENAGPDARFIAAAGPATVLVLLDENDRLRADLAAAEARADRAEESFGGTAAIALGIEDGLRETGGTLHGCTPSMLALPIQKRIAAERAAYREETGRAPEPHDFGCRDTKKCGATCDCWCHEPGEKNA